MLYSIWEGRLTAGGGGQVPVCVEAYRPECPPTDPGAIPLRVFQSAFGHASSHYESHEKFDLICYRAVDVAAPAKTLPPICIFVESDHMHFYCPDPGPVNGALAAIAEDDPPGLTSGSLLYHFLWRQLGGDLDTLEDLENRLNALENEVLTTHAGENYTRQFAALRKHLVAVKGHYEQLGDLFDGLRANENGLFDRRALKQFALLDGKTGRLRQKTVDLLEYLSQIREAAQAEVDISLNRAMQILTIISVIVMPLTLITGWYGMNLAMPEAASPLAYPLVIGLSVLIVAGCILFFKKRKWF